MDTTENSYRKIRYEVESFIWTITEPLKKFEQWVARGKFPVMFLYFSLSNWIDRQRVDVPGVLGILAALFLVSIPVAVLAIVALFCRIIEVFVRTLRSIPFRLLVWHDGHGVATDGFHPSLDMNFPLAWWMTPERLKKHIARVTLRRKRFQWHNFEIWAAKQVDAQRNMDLIK